MRIATFDGGGIKGALPAEIVRRLDGALPGWSGCADALFGASTGALIAAGIATGLSGDKLVGLYRDFGSDIFAPRDTLDRLSGPLDEAFRANYGRDGIDTVLLDVFGDLKLGDCEIPLVIPAFNLTTGQPRYFKGWPDSPDCELLLTDVLGATSAAPTYFPGKRIGDEVFVDGGIFNNNPADSAVAEALDRGAAPDSIRVISFGCGVVPHKFVEPGDDADWGYKGWLVPPRLLDVLFDGALDASTFRAKRALRERFHRLNPALPGVINMDDPGAVAGLVTLGGSVDLDETLAWLKLHWVDPAV